MRGQRFSVVTFKDHGNPGHKQLLQVHFFQSLLVLYLKAESYFLQLYYVMMMIYAQKEIKSKKKLQLANVRISMLG